jgi:squalene-hopene/tetraprenyl-beta-curcumene cyclase
VVWLLDLQNDDGGMPTFCRGWGHLPFDRSSPDLTAHALRAWAAWKHQFPDLEPRVRRAMQKGLQYLFETRTREGTWRPLWFGHQHAPDEANHTYGTAKVTLALADLRKQDLRGVSTLLNRAVSGLRHTMQEDGSWGGFRGGPPSIEETALATEALARVAVASDLDQITASVARKNAVRGVAWLVERVESGAWTQPAPIGFYFAKLWYYERLYPLIFTVGALSQAKALPG